MSPAASPSPSVTSARTPFRTTLSNFTNRRFLRRRRSNPTDSPSEGTTMVSGALPGIEFPMRSSNTDSYGGSPNASPRRTAASLRNNSSRTNSSPISTSPSEAVRRALRSSLVNRETFEPAFQSLTNDVLSGSSDIVSNAIDEIFQQIKSSDVPINSKCLGLEVNSLP